MSPEIIFADTNLFLRYLTNDVPDQAEAFERLLLKAGAGEFSLVTSSLVIAEIIWVLESYYQISKGEIQSKVLAILNTPGIKIDESEILLHAAIWYVEKNVDFIDAFNVAWMDQQGISSVCSFDRKHFSRFEGIEIIVPAN